MRKTSFREMAAASPKTTEKLGFVAKVKGFLISPTTTFRKVKDETLGSPLKYYIIWSLIFGIVLTIATMALGVFIFGAIGALFGAPGLGMLGAGFGATIGVLLIVLSVISHLIALFVFGAWQHLWVYIFGGRKGYTQTIKAMAYSFTPTFLLGWIPFVSIIAYIWALILCIIGIRELHKISTERAVGSVIVSSIISLIILLLIIISLIILFP
jgi:hypothetical protein